MSARVGGVVDTKAGISVSNSHAIPLRAPRPFPAGAELPIRLLMFIANMLDNIATLDAIGVLRDSSAPLPPGGVQP